VRHAATDDRYSKAAGDEPLPGYRLIEPLGRGGFGEVWKCEAPGGLHKAVKFVAGDAGDALRDDASLRQEFEAFQQIKAIRHPFLLTLERVELIRGELVMVMELADRQLLDRFDTCRAAGLPGVPRDELLRYMGEASEALDVIAAEHGLQHLDVKPANLFIIAGHVKVGDYGLVARLEKPGAGPGSGGRPGRGLTPRYAAPEVVNGQVDYRSDQYSLALVYQEMMTGTFPFRAQSAAQILLMHATAAPDLSALPAGDRGPVGRALAKDPRGRFASCQEFINALTVGTPPPPSGPIPRGATARPVHPSSSDHPTATNSITTTPGPTLPPLTVPSRSAPQLRVPRRNPAPPPPPPTPPPTPPTRPAREPDDGTVELISLAGSSQPTIPGFQLTDEHRPVVDPVGQLGRIWSVMAAIELAGQVKKPLLTPMQAPPPTALIEALLRAAGATETVGLTRRSDGSWSMRVPLRALAGVIRLKLRAVAEQWADELVEVDPLTLAVRAYAGGGVVGRWSGKRSGMELVVRLPDGGDVLGEAEVTGRLFGSPDTKFAKSAEERLPRLMAEVRANIQNVPDRRRSPRLPADFPVLVFPVTGDGVVFPAVTGRSRDLSKEGVRFVADSSVVTGYAFVGFREVPGAEGWCLLTRLLRSKDLPKGYEYGGRFRTDLK
jgi:serine/threonine protein kinase